MISARRQRPGDRDPLCLSAGKLVRVAQERILRHLHRVKQFLHPGATAGAFVTAQKLQRRLQDIVNRLARVQRSDRILEDILIVLPKALGPDRRSARIPACDQHAAGCRLLEATSMRASVLLPDPLSAETASVSPRATSSDTAFTALVSCFALPKSCGLRRRSSKGPEPEWQHPSLRHLRLAAGKKFADTIQETLARSELGHAGDQPLRVGMLRIVEYLPGFTGFDDFAILHHGHAVAEFRNDAESW